MTDNNNGTPAAPPSPPAGPEQGPAQGADNGATVIPITSSNPEIREAGSPQGNERSSMPDDEADQEVNELSDRILNGPPEELEQLIDQAIARRDTETHPELLQVLGFAIDSGKRRLGAFPAAQTTPAPPPDSTSVFPSPSPAAQAGARLSPPPPAMAQAGTPVLMSSGQGMARPVPRPTPGQPDPAPSPAAQARARPRPANPQPQMAQAGTPVLMSSGQGMARPVPRPTPGQPDPAPSPAAQAGARPPPPPPPPEPPAPPAGAAPQRDPTPPAASRDDAEGPATAPTVLASGPAPVDVLAVVREILTGREGNNDEALRYQFARLTHEMPSFARGEHLELLEQAPDELVEQLQQVVVDLILRFNENQEIRNRLREAHLILQDRRQYIEINRMQATLSGINEAQAAQQQREEEQRRRAEAARRARRTVVYDRPKELRDYVRELLHTGEGKIAILLVIFVAFAIYHFLAR